MLDRFRGRLEEIRAAILRNDGPLLLEIFTRAKQARDDFIDRFPGRKYGPE
jgi:prephenate dehydrogenase